MIVEYPQDLLLDVLEQMTEETKTWALIPSSGRGASMAILDRTWKTGCIFVTGHKVTKGSANLETLGEGAATSDNNFQVITKYDNGASGFFLGCSQVAIGYDNAFKVLLLGEKGTLEFWQEDNNYLVLRMRNSPLQRLSCGINICRRNRSNSRAHRPAIRKV